MHILWPWRVYNLFIAHCSHLHEKGEEGQYAPLKHPTLGSRGSALMDSISLHNSLPPLPGLTLMPHFPSHSFPNTQLKSDYLSLILEKSEM